MFRLPILPRSLACAEAAGYGEARAMQRSRYWSEYVEETHESGKRSDATCRA